jgi:hypothetical protein
MTPRELSGWVPAETHTHYAPDGETVTGYTVVERESRIDDRDRGDLLALAMYEREVCNCGWHPSIADDESNTFQPATRICPVCAGLATYGRVLADHDKKWSEANRDAAAMVARPSDGRHMTVRYLTPEQAAAEHEKRGGDRGNKA